MHLAAYNGAKTLVSSWITDLPMQNREATVAALNKHKQEMLSSAMRGHLDKAMV